MEETEKGFRKRVDRHTTKTDPFFAKSLTCDPYNCLFWRKSALTYLSGPTDVSIHSVAETLLLFLDSLRVPVIPDEFYRRCLDAAENEVACTQLMSALPPRLDRYSLLLFSQVVLSIFVSKCALINTQSSFGSVVLDGIMGRQKKPVLGQVCTIDRTVLCTICALMKPFVLVGQPDSNLLFIVAIT